MNFYNDIDEGVCAWIRELISAGLIPAGEVSNQSITEINPDDLRKYTQCHFFAGVSGWSEALRLASIDPTRKLWTGSAPCQPFSAAGSQEGQADARHLWPAFMRLIRICRPDCVFGEQVEGAIGFGWLDGIQADLEAEGYAVGHCVLGAHSAGSPNIRQRLYWVAYASSARHAGTGEVEDFNGDGENSDSLRRLGERQSSTGGEHRRLSDALGVGLEGRGSEDAGGKESDIQLGADGEAGFWSSYDLIPCRDGKARRIESGVKPLVDGLPKGMVRVCDPSLPIDAQASAEGRVIRLKGYGNAINPHTAALFICAAESTRAGMSGRLSAESVLDDLDA